jgi:hypothetical protein
MTLTPLKSETIRQEICRCAPRIAGHIANAMRDT